MHSYSLYLTDVLVYRFVFFAQNGFAMASQLLPLGMWFQPPYKALCLTFSPELIDKCVGSKIWVVMKGDKGMLPMLCKSRCTNHDGVSRIQRYPPWL
jgi:hypothetical protein